MRQESLVPINALDSASARTSAIIDANQLINISLQAMCSNTGVEGTLKLQASNQPAPSGYQRYQYTPTVFSDVPNSTITISAGVPDKMVLLSNIAIGYMRVVFTPDGSGSADNITALLTAAGA